MRGLVAALVGALAYSIAVTATAQGVAFPGMPPAPGFRVGFRFPPNSGGGGSYVGPGDIVSGAKAFYGVRAYSAATATANAAAMKLIRASDSHTCDILLASTGDLGVTANCSTGGDNGTAVASWATGTVTIDTWYDQTGNGWDVFQSGSAPGFTLSCQGGKPCAVFAGSQGFDNFGSPPSTAQPLSISVVAIRTGGTGQSDLISGASGVFFSGSFGSGAASGYFGNSPTATAADSAWHALQFVVNSTSSSIRVDGTPNTGLDFGTNALDSDYYIGKQSGSSFLTGKIAEVDLLSGVALNSTQQTALCTNENTYYGLGLTC